MGTLEGYTGTGDIRGRRNLGGAESGVGGGGRSRGPARQRNPEGWGSVHRGGDERPQRPRDERHARSLTALNLTHRLTPNGRRRIEPAWIHHSLGVCTVTLDEVVARLHGLLLSRRRMWESTRCYGRAPAFSSPPAPALDRGSARSLASGPTSRTAPGGAAAQLATVLQPLWGEWKTLD
jgi:hypothetical protein